MRNLSPTKAGLSVGAVLGLWHFVWVALVASGWAKPVMDFVLHLHFIEIHYELAPFAARTAAMLVAITFAVGCVFGFVFAIVWNWLAERPAENAARGTRPAVVV